jgi:hypothetical protein
MYFSSDLRVLAKANLPRQSAISQPDAGARYSSIELRLLPLDCSGLIQRKLHGAAGICINDHYFKSGLWRMPYRLFESSHEFCNNELYALYHVVRFVIECKSYRIECFSSQQK